MPVTALQPQPTTASKMQFLLFSACLLVLYASAQPIDSFNIPEGLQFRAPRKAVNGNDCEYVV